MEGFDPFDFIVELVPIGSEEGPSYGEKKTLRKGRPSTAESGRGSRIRFVADQRTQYP